MECLGELSEAALLREWVTLQAEIEAVEREVKEAHRQWPLRKAGQALPGPIPMLLVPLPTTHSMMARRERLAWQMLAEMRQRGFLISDAYMAKKRARELRN